MANSFPVSGGKNYGLATAGVVLFVFVISLLFAPYYFAGDQVFYGLTYKNMAGRDLMEAYSIYPEYMSSRELVHFFIIWLASGLGVEKNLVMGAANGLLALSLMKLCEQWRVSLLVAASLCITNFYIVVLYFSSERLKFGVLIFLVSVYYLHKRKTSIALSLLAIFAHIQLLIPYASWLFYKLVSSRGMRAFFDIKFKYKNILIGVLVFVAGGILIWKFLGYQISSKFTYYAVAQSQNNDPLIFMRPILLLGMTLWYAKQKTEVVLKFVPIFVAVFLLGGDNVNLFAYAIFMSYALACKRGLNWGVLVTSVYFAYKSMSFIVLTFKTGQGI